jgi:hypothetical protein
MPAVHRQSASTIGCPPNPARRPGSRCPAVRCPARPVSGYLASSSGRGCPAGWCPARPASSRLVSVRPPGRSRLVPRPPGGGDGGDLGTAGSGNDWIESSSMRSGPSPAARSTARGAWMRVPLRRWCAGRRGSVGRGPGPGGASAGGRTRPTGQGRRPRGAPVAGDCAWAGEWLARCCRTAPCGWPSGPGATTTLRGRCGA